MRRSFFAIVPAALFLALAAAAPAPAADNTPPEGFRALFNGHDLDGWKGLVGNPKKRAEMSKEELAAAQQKADDDMRKHWRVEDGALVFDGKGQSLCTAQDYGDFEMLVDWKILEKGDSGIYLRGSPQVQIWDPEVSVPEKGIGSGGLFNNQKHASKPSVNADKPVGQWNTLRIRMVGDKVSVWLNDTLVVDEVVMENYWERGKPIYPTGQIELQNHGNTLYFKNIYLKEL
jgi:3-keto-disaccharide hydrolase